MFIASTPDRASHCKSICGILQVITDSVELCVFAGPVSGIAEPIMKPPSPSIARSVAVQSQTTLPTETAILIEKHLSHFSISFQFLRIGKAVLFDSPRQCKISIFFCLKVKVLCKLRAESKGDPYRLFELFAIFRVYN